ncbi:MAG: undecaprenyl-diphosphatase [Herpetosiphonaceae bacterium]|nr:undecaprenyl-diphosphatase [Herpetosiphonaceae bacterium]
MLSYFEAILFGLLQGITELFPISSLGHSVVLPKLLGWQVNQSDPFFLTFLVATHTATALVLFLFFLKDWQRIITAFFRSIALREIRQSDPDAKLAWLLIVGTVPAGLLGVLFEEPLKALFASPRLVAGVLILNGVMLWLADLLHRNKQAQTAAGSDERVARLTWFQSIRVGLFQAIALVPGFSRTGATITGGLLAGLSNEDAARFSFLLATPIIAAASLLKLPELALQSNRTMLGPILVGTVCAGAAAFVSLRFLTRYFETRALRPFAIYCVVVGVALSLIFTLR